MLGDVSLVWLSIFLKSVNLSSWTNTYLVCFLHKWLKQFFFCHFSDLINQWLFKALKPISNVKVPDTSGSCCFQIAHCVYNSVIPSWQIKCQYGTGCLVQLLNGLNGCTACTFLAEQQQCVNVWHIWMYWLMLTHLASNSLPCHICS